MSGTELDIAGRVLDLARSAAAGADADAEVYVERTDRGLTRFANSFIHQNIADDGTVVRLRLHADGRTAAGSTTLTTAEGLTALVERTVAATRVAPPDPGWPGLAPPAPLTGAAGFDEATAGASPDERAERVRSFVDAAGGLETAGYCRTLRWSGAFVNSAGQTASGQSTEAAMDGIARQGGADGVARFASASLANVDGAALGTRAAAKSRAAMAPVELPPRRYEVVLEPAAVADVLLNLSLWGFNGKAYAERRSFAVLDEPQFDSSVTLVDDPLSPDEIALPFDTQGTPRQRLVLVEAGVTRAVMHDRRTAAEVGGESTGHALGDASRFGPCPINLRFESPGGNGGPPSEVDGPVADSSVAALVAGVERGVLVADLWYTRVLDPKTLVVTGLTRNGVWLIENGELTAPVKNFRFTQSYPQALGPDAVLDIGSHATAQPGGWAVVRWTAPALRLASWNFTGGASG